MRPRSPGGWGASAPDGKSVSGDSATKGRLPPLWFVRCHWNLQQPVWEGIYVMGTLINLALGRLEVDWGKNNFFRDHSALFQQKDLKLVPSYYSGPDWPEGDPIVKMNEGLGKRLREVVDRIELLGYTLTAVEHHYGELRRLHGCDDEDPIPFPELKAALTSVDVTRVSGTYSATYGPGEFVRDEIIDRLSLESRRHDYYLDERKPDHWRIDLLLENFDPYGGLRLLAENPKNLELEVYWDFGPLVDSGWAEAAEFCPGLGQEQRFLVVTEGRSDAHILKHALSLTRPHVADFFQFIDMQDRYPFSGTGNLSKFAQGLASIGIQNNTVILYDNDTEGVRGFRKTQALSLPRSMRVICLPKLDALAAVQTIGPTGKSVEDINGKAAAIECYLDWDCPGLPSPTIRWTSFSEQAESYQGHLLDKERFTERFLQQRSRSSEYDTSKSLRLRGDSSIDTGMEWARSVEGRATRRFPLAGVASCAGSVVAALLPTP